MLGQFWFNGPISWNYLVTIHQSNKRGHGPIGLLNISIISHECLQVPEMGDFKRFIEEITLKLKLN